MRVVVADDSLPVCIQLAESLQEIPGVRVVGLASDGAEALRLVRVARPDVLVLDLRMPILGGLEVLSRLDGDGPPRALVFTQYSDERVAAACRAAGAHAVFDKTRDIEALLDTIESMVHGEGEQEE